MSENQIQISVIWPEVDKLAISRANAFLFQVTSDNAGAPEDIIVTGGYIAPPIVLGSPEEQQAAFGAIRAIPVQPIVRLNLSRGRAQELRDLLNGAIEQFDAQAAATGGKS